MSLTAALTTTIDDRRKRGNNFESQSVVDFFWVRSLG
jgi:hypothetical protein